MNKVYEIQVGCLLYGIVREWLQKWQLQGADIRWKEGSGWISRTFYITGKDALQFCTKIDKIT